jgi:hypothetical protein
MENNGDNNNNIALNYVDECYQFIYPFMLSKKIYDDIMDSKLTDDNNVLENNEHIDIYYSQKKDTFGLPQPQQPQQPPQPPQPQQPPQPPQQQPLLNALNTPIYDLSNQKDSLFWCIFVAKYGHCEYKNIVPTKYLNIAIEEKTKIVNHLKCNEINVKKTLKQNKITMVAFKEMISDVLSNNPMDFKNIWVMCIYYDFSICFINHTKQIYFCRELGNHQTVHNETDDKNENECNKNNTMIDDKLMYFIEFNKNTKPNKNCNNAFVFALCNLNNFDDNKSTTNEMQKQKQYFEKIKDKYVKIENIEKPLKSLSNYKTNELKQMANTLEIPNNDKIKKQELFEKITQYICF